MALWFEMGFILHLLIHRPLRIGNIAALQFRHLQEQPDGGYDIIIPKAEMKNGKFMDRKEWRERFPTRLLPLLHEWLTVWRPRVLRQDGAFQGYVFLNSWGRPFEVQLLEVNLGLMTLRMTQDRPGGPVAWHPHLIRTTWTREMLNAGLNAFIVRRIMGDSFKVIEKHYGGYEQDRPSPFALQLAREIEQRID
jgi:integrase